MRPIDANELQRKIWQQCEQDIWTISTASDLVDIYARVAKQIADMPSVKTAYDENFTYCAGCKWFMPVDKKHWHSYCYRLIGNKHIDDAVHETDYCSWAERRTE